MAAAEMGAATHNFLGDILAVLGAVGMGILIWFCTVFPRDTGEDSLIWRLCPWAAGFSDGAVRVWQMVLGDAEEAIYLVDTANLVLATFLLARSYRLSSTTGRRRLRWFVSGISIGAAVWILQGVVPLILPSVDTRLAYAVASVALVAMPTTALFAVLGDDAMQIDGHTRVMSLLVAGVTVVAIGVFLICVLVGEAWLAQAQSSAVSSSAIVFGGFVAASIASVLTYRGLSPSLNRRLLPERVAFETAPARLAEGTENAATAEELVLALAATLRDILGLRWASPWLLGEDGEFYCVGARPLHADPVLAGPKLEFDDAKTVCTLRLSSSDELGVVLICGPKRSHTRFSREEQVFLGLAVARMNDRLELLESSEALERQRAIISSLRHASSPNTEVLAQVRHDLRQPVEAIRLLGELLESCALDAGARAIATDIVHSVDSMVGIVDAVSEPHVGRETVRLSEVATSLCSRFEKQAAKEDLALSIDLGSHSVTSHRLSLERILANLVGNAIRYTEQGFVEVSATLDEVASDVLIIAVCDSGCGLQAERVDEAFRPYTQLDNGAPEGQGLGLSIVAQLAKLLEHPLEVESSSAGTAIRLRLPRV
jgi:nitrogen-specific signal transduction histidine kinase